jgi:hypothetical protein
MRNIRRPPPPRLFDAGAIRPCGDTTVVILSERYLRRFDINSEFQDNAAFFQWHDNLCPTPSA